MGFKVEGTGIPASTTVTHINVGGDPKVVTLSNKPTLVISSLKLQFDGDGTANDVKVITISEPTTAAIGSIDVEVADGKQKLISRARARYFTMKRR